MTKSNHNGITWLEKAWQKIVNILGILLVILGFLIILFQIVAYLRNGEWIELPVLYLAEFGPDKFTSWLNNATSWIGLHRLLHALLNFFPISIFLMMLGWGMTDYKVENLDNK